MNFILLPVNLLTKKKTSEERKCEKLSQRLESLKRERVENSYLRRHVVEFSDPISVAWKAENEKKIC